MACVNCGPRVPPWQAVRRSSSEYFLSGMTPGDTKFSLCDCALDKRFDNVGIRQPERSGCPVPTPVLIPWKQSRGRIHRDLHVVDTNMNRPLHDSSTRGKA